MQAGQIGLSPRGRGKHSRPQRRLSRRGSIPAWAGETDEPVPCWRRGEVYPRVGGGNRVYTSTLQDSRGLSPRGRGKHGQDVSQPQRLRSIPAWAGETEPAVHVKLFLTVYPRVGGGNRCKWRMPDLSTGLSPRGRGKPRLSVVHSGQRRSIPAWAGETPAIRCEYARIRVYPRVGGGNSSYSRAPQSLPGLSPRGRGKLSELWDTDSAGRSIPAWAGETTPSSCHPMQYAVYPRVGGGN